MKLNKKKIMTVYTVFIFVALASLDNAVIGVIPPLFSSIAEDFNIEVSGLGVVSALTIISTSVSSLVWGYLAGKYKRRNLIIIGTVIWSVSVFFTANSRNYYELIIYQLLTGIGLGCIASIGFSVLTDYIPKNWLGMMMSLWGLSQGFGGIAGSVMASLIAPNSDWRTPFRIISILGTIFIFLYFFIKEPEKGAAEPELKQLFEEGYEYNYKIKINQLFDIIKRKSNKWILFQGFFMSITMGTLVWLPTLYISKIEEQGYPIETAMVASGYLYAILQLGGLFSVYFGYLGDKLQKRTYRGRALLGAASMAVTMPLYIAMFFTPMNNLRLPESTNPLVVFWELIKEILTNPWMLLMFILAVGATTAQSAHSPNWLALITDLNLPEHRATMFSLSNLLNGIGKALGNVLLGPVLAFMSRILDEPENYVVTLTLFQIFLIPSFICYMMISRSSGRDIRTIKSILRKRAKIQVN